MKTNKGITLIALVITVIVLLILAGVAISISVNSGNIFEKANLAVDTANTKAQEQQNNIGYAYDVLNEYVSGISQVSDTTPGNLAGSGTEANPYKIESIEDLVAFAYNVNNGNSYSGKTVVLTQSLDFLSDKSYVNPNATYELTSYGYITSQTGTAIKELLTNTENAGFMPIGNGWSSGFLGTFDGQNNIIYNLYINRTGSGGLFGQSNGGCSISNIGIKQCNVTRKRLRWSTNWKRN